MKTQAVIELKKHLEEKLAIHKENLERIEKSVEQGMGTQRYYERAKKEKIYTPSFEFSTEEIEEIIKQLNK